MLRFKKERTRWLLVKREMKEIFEVFEAVTVKNAVLWDIKMQFVPQRTRIMSPLQSPAG
jgi:hypothetical protein